MTEKCVRRVEVGITGSFNERMSVTKLLLAKHFPFCLKAHLQILFLYLDVVEPDKDTFTSLSLRECS